MTPRLLTFLLLLTVMAGCQSGVPPKASTEPYETVGKDPRRDTDTARAENATAVALLEKGDDTAAESALKRALAADVMFGPAHNNLGKIYYRQNKFYLAGWEFEYASKLMPHHAEPKNNMGMVFEVAGKYDDAVACYGDALRLDPNNPEIISNQARARIHRGDSGPELRDLLTKIITLDSRPQWIQWAKERLALMPPERPPSTSTQP